VIYTSGPDYASGAVDESCEVVRNLKFNGK
jgi:hypothetical protein